MNKIFAAFLATAIFWPALSMGAEVPDWDIEKWCEASMAEFPPDKKIRSKAFLNCKAEENAAKARLAKMDADQNLITSLAREADEHSYVMLESAVIIHRKN